LISDKSKKGKRSCSWGRGWIENT